MRLIILSLILIGLPSCAPSSSPPAEAIAQDAANPALDVAVAVRPESLETRVMPKPTAESAELNEDLGLEVVGRIAGDDGAATLKLPSGKVVTYRRGDEIMSGVTLKAIDRNFVVIDVKGQDKKLAVSKGWAPSKPPSKIGYTVKADGSVVDSTGKKIGHVNAKGDIVDPDGKVIGRIKL